MLVDVIIPTKSNFEGLAKLNKILSADTNVAEVFVIADGKQAWEGARKVIDNAHLFQVELGSGIHVMWNIGLKLTVAGHHALFLNDDVDINEDTISGLIATLNKYSRIGVVCPNYSGELIRGPYRPVTDTCSGRYDGSGGLGGFCMMLRNSLVREWKFDERMKWWYGDDDLVNWIVHVKKMVAAIASNSTCSDNVSWTIENDPPPDFNYLVERDGIIFRQKWS